MTQANETSSRIARLEALMLEIAAANLRHDRDSDRHEQRIAEHEEWQRQHEAAMQRINAQQELNQQAIAQLTAGLVELRNLVTDYIRGRSET